VDLGTIHVDESGDPGFKCELFKAAPAFFGVPHTDLSFKECRTIMKY